MAAEVNSAWVVAAAARGLLEVIGVAGHYGPGRGDDA